MSTPFRKAKMQLKNKILENIKTLKRFIKKERQEVNDSIIMDYDYYLHTRIM